MKRAKLKRYSSHLKQTKWRNNQMAKEEKVLAEQVVRDVRREIRRKYSAEEKIRIVLEGLCGEDSIARLCRREGINPNMYYKWRGISPSLRGRANR
jgi:Transposase